MIKILGSRKQLCDGVTRRDLMHLGGLGALGLSLSDYYALQAAQAAAPRDKSFGQAKACILLFLFGSPPQHETFDPKPEAPAEVQGEMKAIPTNVPGLSICEGLPRIARIMDKVTLVRSMVHPYPVHGVAYALSAMAEYTPAIEARPRDPRHWPFMGSVVDHLESARRPGHVSEMPRNIGLPWLFGSKSDLPNLAGPYAAFLGSGHDPVWTEFQGEGTHVVPKLTDGQSADVRDPFAGIKPGGKLILSPACQLPGDVPRGRLDVRKSLLDQFNASWRTLDQQAAARTFDQHGQRAYSLIGSHKVAEALDVQRESAATREAYGATLFGQACLAARRLVESGCKFVSVFWDPYGPFGGSVWDTHSNHFPRLRDYLLPVFDQTYSALIVDLQQRGLLDETLVICTSEHGRTPKINSKPKGAGRDHWSRAYSSVFAGGGMAMGNVVGRTDSIASDVIETPVSPKDMQATAYHLLGIDAETMIRDKLGRPLPIAGDGRVRRELLS